jgi:hypothetical protein
MHTRGELLEMVFSTGSALSIYCGNKLDNIFSVHVEAGLNISTVDLQVIRGDEEGTQRLGVQQGHPVPGEYKYPPGWGSLESETVKYGHESHGTQT